MSETSTVFPHSLAGLKRPRLLIRAARFGLADYDRSATLSRLFPSADTRPGQACLRILRDRETRLNEARVTGGFGYSLAAHVEVLTALIHECRMMAEACRLLVPKPDAGPSDQENASGISALRRAT